MLALVHSDHIYSGEEVREMILQFLYTAVGDDPEQLIYNFNVVRNPDIALRWTPEGKLAAYRLVPDDWPDKMDERSLA